MPVRTSGYKRIRFGIVNKSHGLNLRSGKALCSVTPSGSVTTRRNLPSSDTKTPAVCGRPPAEPPGVAVDSMLRRTIPCGYTGVWPAHRFENNRSSARARSRWNLTTEPVEINPDAAKRNPGPGRGGDHSPDPERFLSELRISALSPMTLAAV